MRRDGGIGPASAGEVRCSWLQAQQCTSQLEPFPGGSPVIPVALPIPVPSGFNTQMASANTSCNFDAAERLALANFYHGQCPVTQDDAIHHAHIIPHSDGALLEARRVVRRSYHSIKSSRR